MPTKPYSRHVTCPAQSNYFFYVAVFVLFLSLIPLLSPVTTNTRSERGVWTAILLVMSLGCTAEQMKLLLFMERHSGLCLTPKICDLLMQNPHMYEVIEVAVLLSSISQSEVCEHAQCDTPH